MLLTGWIALNCRGPRSGPSPAMPVPCQRLTAAIVFGPWRRPSPSVWVRERCKWSDNQVVGTTQESNVFRAGGTWTLSVRPRGSAGSHIRVNFDRRWKGKGWLSSLAAALFGRQMFTRNLQKTLSVLERTPPGAHGDLRT